MNQTEKLSKMETFPNHKTFETTVAGRPFIVETGKMAGLANGSCFIHYGETRVLCTATMGNPREGIDFFPLSVDFEEKMYAVGKIPGSFMRREGRPGEKAVLTGRLIDRQIRPLFPDNMRDDVSISVNVLSVDREGSAAVAGMIGASIALSISDIPWNGPIAGMNVGFVDGELVLDPSEEQLESSTMELTVAASRDKIVMIEAGASEVDEATVMDGIRLAHEEINKIIPFIEEMTDAIGKPKATPIQLVMPEGLFDEVKDEFFDQFQTAMDTDDKTVRDEQLAPICDELTERYAEEHGADIVSMLIDDMQKLVIRRWLLEDGKRVDGRGVDEIRPLAAEVDLLPRAHGSGMFTRAQTQALTVATLSTLRDAQIIDDLSTDETKRFMHHYNFPAFSVGESRPARGPGRREIGHGALAEKALLPVLPEIEEFPYSIRLVSEILSSNGSTSQAAICGSSLALMDAGVPISQAVAGISCGLITDEDRWLTMLDIQGIEDFFGDMDFKVGGTVNGITAIQMDIKFEGLTHEMVEEALEKTRKARIYILEEIMNKAIAAPREELSEYAPKMLTMQIDPEKIRDVIGKGGKVIQEISAVNDVKIDVEDDGQIFISGIDINGAEQAMHTIKTIVEDPEIGSIYKGKVTRLMNFGAFVEIVPGKEGLVHISKLEDRRVERVEDVLGVGDEVLVKVIEIDQQGRLNLSRRDALADLAAAKKEDE